MGLYLIAEELSSGAAPHSPKLLIEERKKKLELKLRARRSGIADFFLRVSPIDKLPHHRVKLSASKTHKMASRGAPRGRGGGGFGRGGGEHK